MDAQLRSGIACLLDRLGDGHGRRILLLATGVEDADVSLATELAKRAWAVACQVSSPKVAKTAQILTESAGVVVDWRSGTQDRGERAGGRFAVIASLGDPGIGESEAGAGLSDLLHVDGTLMFALAAGADVPDLAGFCGVSVALRHDVTLVSARRAG